MTLYDTLGINKDATEKEIKEAFKSKAKENHPDKKGGDTDKMVAINKAYSVLGDKERKEKYDTTGSTENTSFENKFIQYVNEVFMRIVNETEDVKTSDVIKIFKINTKAIIKANKEKQKDLKHREEKLNIVIKKLKVKNDQTILTVLNGHLAECGSHILGIENEIAFLNQCLDIINFYYYDFDLKQSTEEPPLFQRIFTSTQFDNI